MTNAKNNDGAGIQADNDDVFMEVKQWRNEIEREVTKYLQSAISSLCACDGIIYLSVNRPDRISAHNQ